MWDYVIGGVIGLVLPTVVSALIPNKTLFNIVFFQAVRLVDWSRAKFGAAIVKPVRSVVQNSLRIIAMALDEGLGVYDRYERIQKETGIPLKDSALMQDPYTFIMNERKKINGKKKIEPNPGSPLSAYK